MDIGFRIKYLGEKQLNRAVGVCLTFYDTATLFTKEPVPLISQLIVRESCTSLAILDTVCLVHFSLTGV